MKYLKIKAEFIEEALGLCASDKEVHKTYIASRAPEAPSRPEKITEEIDALGDIDEVAQKQMTVFPKEKDGTPFFWDYQLRGFFKDAAGALQRAKGEEFSQATCKLKAYKKIIDSCIFIKERRVDLHMPEGGEIGKCERPLRAQTAQGERIALASSETVPEGTTMEFTIVILGGKDYEDAVKEWLNYGVLKGTGCWRNSGKGRFTYEIVSEENIKSLKEISQFIQDFNKE